jgi:3-hydroxyisobutyrate dehydrogenase-like beta-hydroxyacid dehydrogenase
MELGFIGLGKMGKPMVANLLAAGHRVRVYNRSQLALSELAAQGAEPAADAKEVARKSQAVLTALPTIEAVLSTYEAMAEVAVRGQIFVDHSTVSTDVNRACAARLELRGAAFLDAPVSGGPGGAADGTLTVMVGGDEEIFQRMLPVFQALGKNIKLCGPVGAGQAVKLVNQLLVGINTAAVAEAVVFGAKLGADPKVVLELIGTSFGGSTMMTRNLPRMMKRDFTAATSVNLLLKDLGIIHDEARRLGVPVLLGGLVEQRFLEAAARGWGQQDMAALVQLWEEPAGTQVRGT